MPWMFDRMLSYQLGSKTDHHSTLANYTDNQCRICKVRTLLSSCITTKHVTSYKEIMSNIRKRHGLICHFDIHHRSPRSTSTVVLSYRIKELRFTLRVYNVSSPSRHYPVWLLNSTSILQSTQNVDSSRNSTSVTLLEGDSVADQSQVHLDFNLCTRERCLT